LGIIVILRCGQDRIRFETLVHIILEQQVSLASALAALNKLRERLKEITPKAFLKIDGRGIKGLLF